MLKMGGDLVPELLAAVMAALLVHNQCHCRSGVGWENRLDCLDLGLPAFINLALFWLPAVHVQKIKEWECQRQWLQLLGYR